MAGDGRLGEVRIGLLGCGRIARHFHLPLLAPHLAAVADADAASLEAARAVVPSARLHAHWRDLLEAAEVDAVVVCLPPALHAPAAVAAFEAGLHVYVEKPLALALEDAERVEAAWLASGRCGAVGFNFRFNPNFRALRERLAAGELGRAVALTGAFASPRRAPADWKASVATGGGALRDLAVHHLDLVAFVCGEPVARAVALERTVALEGDAVAVHGALEGGAPVQLVATQCTAHAANRLELLCEAGRLVAAANDPAPRRVERAPGRLARVARARDRVAGLAPRRLLHPPGAEPSFALALGAFVDAASGRAPWTGADVADGRRVAALIDAIESGGSGSDARAAAADGR